MEQNNTVSLVIFTCEGRELLLNKTLTSFRKACPFSFDKVILAIDGYVNPGIIDIVNPDVVLQNTRRKGYVNSIVQTLSLVNTPYFFWLEDDWLFNKPFDLDFYLQQLSQHPDWVEIYLSKYGPLNTGQKQTSMGHNFYRSDGFSANPNLSNTQHVRDAFSLIVNSPKGDTLGTDGFENSLTATYSKNELKCIIVDPIDHLPITHDGYLESTPRNWHMTNSLEKKTEKHLLVIPSPSLARKLLMTMKLAATFCKLAFMQLFSNKVYEFCFRVISGAKTLNNNDQ